MTKRHTGLAALCVAMFIAVVSFPGVARAQAEVHCASDVRVQSGDSLMAIAERYYGQAMAYPRIVEATNAVSIVDASYATIDDPGFIGIGWKLCIPDEPVTGEVFREDSTGSDDRTEYFAELLAVAATDTYNEYDPMLIRELAVTSMRERSYPSSEITIVETLPSAANYARHTVTYRSDGLTIHAHMTMPLGERPVGGWPVIIFNRGYVPPDDYSPLAGYERHIDGFARSGYIVLVPEYRGHGESEGRATGYLSPGYTVDVLNAVAAIKTYPEADGQRIGMWGHSLGGDIVLRSMVISDDIRAGVIWSGVVAPVADLLALIEFSPIPVPEHVLDLRQMLFDEFGSPDENSVFWDSISPNSFLADLSGPIQLHHGTDDLAVPVVFSNILDLQSTAAGADSELYTYAGDDHVLSASVDIAMARSVQFFDRHLKGQLALAE